MIAARACSVCGDDFVPRHRSTAFLCSPACKQAAYRKRLRRARVTDSPPPKLTFELRRALRAEVDRLNRAALAEANRDEAKRLLAMFADEVVT
jgi:predicted RNA-binding Zn-ribbon protein involved in translation (DUF1610 family)